MQATLLEYLHRDSPLHHMDARWKLVAIALGMLGIVTLQTVAGAVAALVMALVLLGASQLPYRWFLARLAGVAVILLLFVVLLPFTLPGEPIDLGPVQMSKHGLHVGLLIATKALAMVALALVLFATAPFEVTMKAARALRVPGVLVQLLLLTHRYIYLFADELGKLRIALRTRRYRNRPNAHSYRTLGHVTGTLLVRSYERAERVGQAMRSRGFDGRLRTLQQFQTRSADPFKFCLLVFLIALVPMAVDASMVFVFTK